MHLRKDADITQFLQAASRCRRDVYFCTLNGDKLNLKTELMRMVFATQAGNDAFLYSSSIEVLDEKDAQVLADYICT